MSEPRLERAIDDAWPGLVPLGAVLVASRLWLGASGTYTEWDEGAMSVILDVYRLTVTWVAVLALMALGRRFLWFEIPLLRWGNEGAYPIYLPHQSVIVVVAYLLLEAWDAPAVTGWAVVTVVSIAVTVAVYE
jgi:glucan biosynthesis protein C